MRKTFGPAYDEKKDGARIGAQMQAVRDAMLGPGDVKGLGPALQTSGWWTLAELREATGYPEASISAQLRHLRKKEFGQFIVEKRRREEGKGTWEYQIRRPEKQMSLYAHLPGCATHP